MFKQSNIFLFIITFIFSAPQLDKIDLSKQLSKTNPQEKPIIQKKNNFKIDKFENIDKRITQKIIELSKNNREECPEGTVDDCSGDGDCCPEEWIGDGYSDCEDQQYGCDLTCYENDGGDCESDGRGDVSLDREINILDVVSLTGFVINIAQPSDNEFWAGDINQDRTLDILDIVLLIDIIFQN